MEHLADFLAKTGRHLWHSIVCILLAVSVVAVSGCSKSAAATVPYVPPSYLACTEVTPYQLVNVYYGRYGSRMRQAEVLYNGSPFVFKNIRITTEMLTSVPQGCIWVGLVKCCPLTKDGLSSLKIDSMVDIIGIDAGMCPEYHGLVFTGCVFLPAGIVQLPLEGSTSLPLSIY